MIKYIRYTHPASAGYDADLTYRLNEIIEKEGIEKTKAFFTPVDFKWEDLESPKVEEEVVATEVVEEAKKENHRRNR